MVNKNEENQKSDHSIIEKLRIFLNSIVEIGKAVINIAKGISFIAAILIVVGAKINPSATGKTIDLLGLEVKSDPDKPLIKSIQKQGNISNVYTSIASQAITSSLIEIEKIIPTANAEEIIGNLKKAQDALDHQTSAVNTIADGSGLLNALPIKTGWIQIGYFGEDGILKWTNNKIYEKPWKDINHPPKSLIVTHDAYVTEDGDNCNSTNLEDYKPSGEPILYTIIKSTPEPIKIKKTASCKTRGKGEILYAMIDIPPYRARISSINNIR